MSATGDGEGDGEEIVLVLPVTGDLERRLVLALGLYPADRLFVPVPVGRPQED